MQFFRCVTAALTALFLIGSVCTALALEPDDPVPSYAQRQESSLSDSISTLSDQVSRLSEQVSQLGGDARTAEDDGSGLADEQNSAADENSGLGSGAADLSQNGLHVTETEEEVKIEISADVLFDFDRWGIRPDAAKALIETTAIIDKYPGTPVTLEGHTDSIGTNEYNQDLSIKRAKSVSAWFIHRSGLNPKRFVTRGYGESRPVAPNAHSDGSDNPEGRQRNRRVEITVKKSA